MSRTAPPSGWPPPAEARLEGTSIALAPLAAAVPGYATASVLVLVGLAMFQTVTSIDFRSLEDGLPAFVTIVLIPLTLSISRILCTDLRANLTLVPVAKTGPWIDCSTVRETGALPRTGIVSTRRW